MTITFAGHMLLLEDPEGMASRFVRTYAAVPHSIINAAPRVISPDSYCQPPNWPAIPPLKLNQLYVPSGASRWARGLFLCDQETLDAMADDDAGALVFHNSYPTGTNVENIVGDDPDETTVTWDLGSQFGVRMHKLEPIPVSDSGDETLWILPLVDERYWWQSKTIVSEADTWLTLVSELATAMAAGTGVAANEFVEKPFGVAEYTDAPLADPLVSRPDPCFFRRGPIAIGPAMDLACWSLGLRFVPGDLSQLRPGYRLMAVTDDQTDATYPRAFTVYDSQIAAVTASDKPGAAAGGETVATGHFGDIPAEITMRFVDNVSDPAVETHSKSVAPDLETYGDGTLEVWSPAVAASGDPPANEAELDDIAEKWSASLFKWLRFGYSWSLNQMPLWRFAGYEDYLLFDNGRQRGATYNSLLKTKTLPRHFGYEYVALQVDGGQDRACCCAGRWFQAIEDFTTPDDGCTGETDPQDSPCGNHECVDYTSGLCNPLKKVNEPVLCKCYVPIDEEVRVFDLVAPDVASTLQRIPKAGDRLYAIKNPQSQRWEVVRTIDMQDFVCCNCEACYETEVFSITAGACTESVQLKFVPSAAGADGCHWTVPLATVGDLSFSAVGLLKADNVWRLTFDGVTCAGGSSLGTAVYEIAMPNKDCASPILLYKISETGSVTWPDTILLNAVVCEGDPPPCPCLPCYTVTASGFSNSPECGVSRGELNGTYPVNSSPGSGLRVFGGAGCQYGTSEADGSAFVSYYEHTGAGVDIHIASYSSDTFDCTDPSPQTLTRVPRAGEIDGDPCVPDTITLTPGSDCDPPPTTTTSTTSTTTTAEPTTTTTTTTSTTTTAEPTTTTTTTTTTSTTTTGGDPCAIPCEWKAYYNVEDPPVLIWVRQNPAECTSGEGCECAEPAFAPSVVHEETTTSCGAI